MSYKDYYAVLGVAKGATQADITASYRKLARKYHPDVSKEPDAEARFKEIGTAYEVLKDPEKRKLYDQYGESWKAVSEGRAAPPDSDRVRVDFQNAGFDPEDLGDLGSIFETFFGGRRRGWPGEAAGRPAQGMDIESEIALDVEQAFHGGEQILLLGDPFTGQQKRLTVKIPPGVRSGQRIRLAGQGGPGPSPDKAGDLYLKVRLVPSARFRFEGTDLVADLPLAPWEAALGGTVDFKTLDGSVRLKVPAGTSTGQKMRLRNKGYPLGEGVRGDLLAEVRIVVPATLSDEERKLFEELAEVSAFKARSEAR